TRALRLTQRSSLSVPGARYRVCAARAPFICCTSVIAGKRAFANRARRLWQALEAQMAERPAQRLCGAFEWAGRLDRRAGVLGVSLRRTLAVVFLQVT